MFQTMYQPVVKKSIYKKYQFVIERKQLLNKILFVPFFKYTQAICRHS